jgi:hypothetical protein
MQVQQQPSNIVYTHQHQGSLLSTISEEDSGEVRPLIAFAGMQ